MTARNLQDEAKKRGLPWSAAKGFDTFTPIGKYHPKSGFPRPDHLRLQLSVNGSIKQDGCTEDMIFKIPQLLEHITSIMTLEPGDVVLTGTPSGVGPVIPGDVIEAKLIDLITGARLSSLKLSAIARQGGYQFKNTN